MGIAAQAEVERLNRRNLLPLLLVDKTSRHNIIWATDAYQALGNDYKRGAVVTAASLLQPPFRLMSRADKEISEQSQRTKAHAEVFTPLWMVRKMNDYIEEEWFGFPEPFAGDRVVFPKGRRWQRYVDSKRLEITCGEAPYLVTRYDVTTGEHIPLRERVGMLDRKLRIVNENTGAEEEWIKWMFRSFQATYGYEFQGDNVLLARLNLLLTFEEYMEARLHREPTAREYRKLLNILSWNIWQMDGLTGTIPYCREPEQYEQLMFDWMEPAGENRQPPCRIFDWRAKCSMEYNALKRRK